MSEKSRFRENAEFMAEHWRALAVLTVLGIAAILYFGRFGGNTEKSANQVFDASNLPQSTVTIPAGVAWSDAPQSQPGQPDIVYVGVPDSQGITNAIIFGSIPVRCATINFPYSYFDQEHIDPEYDSSLPPITYGAQALSLLGVSESSVSAANPIYVARGVNVQTVISMEDHTWNMLNNSTGICD